MPHWQRLWKPVKAKLGKIRKKMRMRPEQDAAGRGKRSLGNVILHRKSGDKRRLDEETARVSSLVEASR